MATAVPDSATPDLVACVMRLVALEGATLERTQGHRVHALFLDLMRRSDPALAAMLHADGPVKPFTVASLQERGRRLQAGDEYVVRLALLRGDLYLPFASVFLRGTPPELQVGTARFAVREVQTTPEGHPWAGVASWSDLVARARPEETIAFDFVTPTAFSQSEDARGKKQYGLFPEPKAVFGSLLRRWNLLAPAPLPADLLERLEVLPSRYELRTAMLRFGKGPQLGFTGYCAYQVHGPETERVLLAMLAEAAFFLGVGYKTTQGMGLVRRVRPRP
jgi:CRISPR-associated endoribonuclease Cas6